MLTLQLFGAATVEGPEGPVTGRGTRGPRLGLLALLALSRGRPVTRDRVVALLWPEAGPQRARAQLSDTLYLLRASLGEGAVVSSGDDLLLNADAVTSDVAVFERLLALGQLEAAVGLAAGPVLDGFHLPRAAEFDQWLSRERAELADRAAGALESLAESAESGGDYGGAVRWWRRLAALDPGSGRVALRLMRALDASGDRAGAFRVARGHGEVLRREFDATPDPDVAALEDLLRREPLARAAIAPVPAGPGADDRASRSPAAPGAATAGAARAPRRRLPRVLAALAVVALAVWSGARLARSVAAPTAGEPSVAVLPFADLGTDSGGAYFSDGLSEQVIAALSRIGGLRLAARSSSFGLRGSSSKSRTGPCPEQMDSAY